MFHWATFRVEADRRKRNDGRAVGVICGGGCINHSCALCRRHRRDNRDKQMCCTRAAGTGSRELKLKEQEEKKHVYEPKRG